MHPLRKLRESGKPTPAQVSALLAENIVFNSPILVRPIEGREVIAAIFAQSSSTRGSGTYTAEFKLDERQTYRGRAAIKQWKADAAEKYQHTSKPFALDQEQGKTVVTSHLTGNFPRSPVNLRYFFELESDKIKSLEIIPLATDQRSTEEDR